MSTDDPTEAYQPFPPEGGDDILRRLDSLPSMNDDPVVWDARQSKFVPASEYNAARQAASASNPPVGSTPSEPTAPPRHVVVEPGAPSVARSNRPASPAPGRQRPAGQGPGGQRSAGAPVPPSARRKVVLTGAQRRRWPWPLRWLRRLVILWLLLFLFVGGGLFLFGWVQFNKIPKAAVAPALSAPSGQGSNFLIVGTDSREGINPTDPNAKAFLGPGEPEGAARTDTIMVLRVEADRRLMMSIPRDLWVKNPRSGEMGRINSVYQSGPEYLVKAVQSLGIPVHHYVEINFVSFGSLVDALGGIDIDFPFPARDTNSGLYIDTAGPHTLNGVDALAFVRSRYYEELKDGKYTSSGLADLDRIKRQQVFLKALTSKLAVQKDPSALARTMGSLGGGVKIDERLSYVDAIGLVWKLRSFNPESRSLTVLPRRTTGGAEVLDLMPSSADVVAEFSR